MRTFLLFVLVPLLLAALGVLGFGVVHALTIVPIWARLPGGLPFALAAALPTTWAFREVFPSSNVRSGLMLGTILWFTLLPNAAVRYAFTRLGLHAHIDPLEDIVGFLLPFLLGGLIGYAMTRRPRSAFALGLASSGFTVASAGPLAMLSGGRPLRLGIGLLAVCLITGLALPILVKSVDRTTGARA